MADKAKGRVELEFQGKDAFRWVDDPIHKDLSAAARIEDSLFLSCDETAGIDRLTPKSRGTGWGNHVHFALADMIELPGGPDGEMDIEGLEVEDDWLWVVGSHALKRAKPDGSGRKALENLAEIERDPNRSFLARLPLTRREDGAAPVAQDGERRMACVKLKKKADVVRKWLKKDPHLSAFLEVPCKENGLDIEGLAADGMRIWLGLRGPVLRSHAVVLELSMKVTKKGRLKAKKIEDGRRYRKHLLPTNGMGIRDLRREGDDLIVLTGPSLAGDGTAQVLRWKNGRYDTQSGVVAEARLEVLARLPYRAGRDHPEGLARWGEDWLVVYDNPAPARLKEKPARVTADIWAF